MRVGERYRPAYLAKFKIWTLRKELYGNTVFGKELFTSFYNRFLIVQFYAANLFSTFFVTTFVFLFCTDFRSDIYITRPKKIDANEHIHISRSVLPLRTITSESRERLFNDELTRNIGRIFTFAVDYRWNARVSEFRVQRQIRIK